MMIPLSFALLGMTATTANAAGVTPDSAKYPHVRWYSSDGYAATSPKGYYAEVCDKNANGRPIMGDFYFKGTFTDTHYSFIDSNGATSGCSKRHFQKPVLYFYTCEKSPFTSEYACMGPEDGS